MQLVKHSSALVHSEHVFTRIEAHLHKQRRTYTRRGARTQAEAHVHTQRRAVIHRTFAITIHTHY